MVFYHLGGGGGVCVHVCVRETSDPIIWTLHLLYNYEHSMDKHDVKPEIIPDNKCHDHCNYTYWQSACN